LQRSDEALRRYKNIDNDPRGVWTSSDLTVKRITEKDIYEVTTPSGKKILPTRGRSWNTSKEKMQLLIKSNRVYFGEDGNNVPRLKRFLTDVKEGITPMTVWTHKDVGHNQDARKEIIKLFNNDNVDFVTPKPEKLLQRIIEIATKKGDLVLDYHLGSGTTCAVAHKMGRQYIGIEQMDYIEDIAVKRMSKVIGEKVKKDGELLESVDFDTGGISKANNWQGGGEFIYFELAKYNQQYIDNLNAIKQGHGSTKTTNQLYDEIIDFAFLNYDVESDKLKAEKSDFEALSLANQLEFLFSILNKNQLYKNLTEMDDKDLVVDEKTKDLNNNFYNA
jgi:adenine-specific DNA-methyltransferase